MPVAGKVQVESPTFSVGRVGVPQWNKFVDCFPLPKTPVEFLSSIYRHGNPLSFVDATNGHPPGIHTPASPDLTIHLQ